MSQPAKCPGDSFEAAGPVRKSETSAKLNAGLLLQDFCAAMAHSVLAQQTLLKSISVGTGSVHKATTLSKHGSVATPTKVKSGLSYCFGARA